MFGQMGVHFALINNASYIWSKFCFKVKHYSKYDPAGFLLHFSTFLKTSGKKSLRPTLAGYEEGSQGGELF